MLNPNSSAAMTDLMVRHARDAVPGAAIAGHFAPDGPPFIGDDATYDAAADTIRRLADAHGAAADGLLIACFGDPGLDALRARADCPVTGLAEASLLMATSLGRRIGIVTGGAAWVPLLERFVARQGLTARISSIAAVALKGPQMAQDPGRAVDVLVAEALAGVRAGADVVVFGGGALAGLAALAAPQIGVPVVDCVRAGALHLEALIRLRAHDVAGSFAHKA